MSRTGRVKPVITSIIGAALVFISLAVVYRYGLEQPAPKPDTTNLGFEQTGGSSPNSWIYPVPFRDQQLGFLGLNSEFGGYHLAVDFNCRPGEPVRALAGGKVLVSRTDLSGYGGLNKPGGAVLILHRTSEGGWFKALYGHLDQIRVEAGDLVAPGQVLGAINQVSHLHFGIHPGESLSAYPCLGYTRSRENPRGWVDPVEFLGSHSPEAQ
ncbi:MAG: M23 family metallopeptidase [Firmicutes bacterium]|nr:M23 family metallopeptidase [Bacillota bacterium]